MASSAMARGATAMLESMAKQRWGYPPRLMAATVAELGPLRALWWFAWNLPRYHRTLSTFGEVRAYLLCLAISLVNGSAYCVSCYTYALQLAYLRKHGRLFPLDESAIDDLRGLPPAVIRSRLSEATHRAALHGEVRFLDRAVTLALEADPRPTDTDEVRIAHLVRMFRDLSLIAIATGIAPDEAPTPLNKDRGLKVRYAEMRAAARR